MNTSENTGFSFKAELNTKEFNRLSKFIMTEYGIKMPPEKRIMLQSRLQKRLKALQMNSFKEYVEYLFSDANHNEEVIHMMDVVSTNKTDFFRESVHFDFLLSKGISTLANDMQEKNINIWSAGCSSGEEAYTIAFTMSEYIENNPGIDFSITASDISTKMLNIASCGIFHEDRVLNIPVSIKKKYFLRSINRDEKRVKIVTDIRKKVTFYRQNLLYLPMPSKPIFHIIFCRNVLIYFDRENQFKILTSLCNHLKPGGFLFLGHSESIAGYDLPVNNIQPTIFRKN
ncbi:MAG: hypothetical protein JXJ22_02705 [Bacteroidales bacterium]|nr:hypothetical protein [Bacteroidales bacterium]